MSESTYRLTIGGESVEGGAGTYEIINPATEEVAGLAPEASVEQANAAVEAAAEAFDEFGESPPQWGDWMTKEKQAPLSGYKIPEQISSPKCVGVLIITNPASHAMTNQAKEAAEKAGRPFVWIEYATKKKIREGIKSLVEKIQQGNSQQQASHRAPR